MAVTSAALLACIFPFAALAKKAVEKVVEKVVAPMFENSLAGSYALMMSTSMGIEAKLQLMTAQPILAAVPVAVVLLAVFVLFIAVKANTPQTVSKSSAPPPPE